MAPGPRGPGSAERDPGRWARRSNAHRQNVSAPPSACLWLSLGFWEISFGELTALELLDCFLMRTARFQRICKAVGFWIQESGLRTVCRLNPPLPRKA